MKKQARVILRGQAKESYEILEKRDDKQAIALLKSIERMKGILKTDPQYGDVLKKTLIPDAMRVLGVTTLYRVELAHYWRMIYTIQDDTVEIYVIILTISDHPTYDKILGYRKK